MIEKLRTRQNINKVIALSISWQRENLLARGLGLEHLRDLLLRLARPILRTGASLAYAGNWLDVEDNFTYELLRLISAEQEDNSLGGPDTSTRIGLLYNHSAWPHYLSITPRTEAQWINCCRIVRVTQQMAGIPDSDIVPNQDATKDLPRTKFNAAISLSAMRQLMMSPMLLDIPDASPLSIPPTEARILLGGKVAAYSGFLPGLFEEALATLQHKKPLFILGGFGGAAQILAQGILQPAGLVPPELGLAWHRDKSPGFARFLDDTKGFTIPPGLQSSEQAFHDLANRLLAAQSDPGGMLNTGLSPDETRQLLTTSDPHRAVKLVRLGLVKLGILPVGPDNFLLQ